MDFTLKIWRQKDAKTKGYIQWQFVSGNAGYS